MEKLFKACFFIFVLFLLSCNGNVPENVKGKIANGENKKMTPADFKKMTPEQRQKMREAFGKKGGEKPVLVSVEMVKKGNLNNYLVLNGTVEPERQVKVYCRLSAFVEKKLHEEGDYVKKGDILCKLDETEIRISYQQAKIQLEQSELVFKSEERTFNRNKNLSKNSLISEEELQAAEAAFEKARLDFENKKEDFKNLKMQLGYTSVKSPVDGYITERLVEIGDRVNSNQHVFTVEDFNPFLVKVYVPSSDAIGLKEGMKVDIISEIISDKVFTGKIKIINPRIDINSGTVKVTLEVKDDTHSLKPGMFVETRIIKGKKENVIVVPKKCISFQSGKTYVYVNNNGIAEKRELITGMNEEDNVEVLEGLKEGESLVIVGVESLKDKSRIRMKR